MVYVCCVRGCNNSNRDAQMHVFPKKKELFPLWVRYTAREDLLTKSIENIRKSYRICDIHFSHKQRYVGMRNKSTLAIGAFPDLITVGDKVSEATQSTSKSTVSDDEMLDNNMADEASDSLIEQLPSIRSLEIVYTLSCSKCHEELKEKTFCQCDGCKAYLHYSCTELSPIEIDCMRLKTKRTLKFFCTTCEEGLSFILNEDNATKISED